MDRVQQLSELIAVLRMQAPRLHDLLRDGWLEVVALHTDIEFASQGMSDVTSSQPFQSVHHDCSRSSPNAASSMLKEFVGNVLCTAPENS